MKEILKLIILRWTTKNARNAWFKCFMREHYHRLKVLKKLSSEDCLLLKEYYKKIWGTTIQPYWHEYYYSMTGRFSERYIPNDIFYPFIVPYLNRMDMAQAYLDKNNYENLFPSVRQPGCILKNINGYYYQNQAPLTEEDAIEVCSNLERAIIKPTLDSCQGRNVKCFSTKESKLKGETKSVRELFQKYNRNFIVQEVIRQHPVIAALNPTSVNTIRVVTYRRGNEIIHLSSILRVGRDGEIVDNGHAGGFCCGIKEDGCLKPEGYVVSKNQIRQKTDSGVAFEGIKIPEYNKILMTARDLHFRLPYLNLVGWDFSVDEHNEVVLIEFNTEPDIEMMQLPNGPVLGEYTDEILRIVSHLRYDLRVVKVSRNV